MRGYLISCVYIYGMIKNTKVMEVQIGTQFKMPPSYTNKHIYEIVGETENEHFWIVKNTSYPEYDDRGKGKFIPKWEVHEKMENKKFIKL